jgi:hypothetical protein
VLARAVLAEGCAPHDAGATVITVRPQETEFPSIGITWWASERALRGKAGRFTLEGEPSYDRGYSANYCAYQYGCQVLRKLTVRLKLEADGKGELELDAETIKGETFHLTVPAAFGPMQRIMCG